MELLFLSFTNLSSTGLSDVVPITAHARSVVMIEQLAGLGYVALFVSRLVGLTISRQMAGSSHRRTLMAPRLLIIAHAETPGSRALVFGDGSASAWRPSAVWGVRVARWVSAPDPACRATAEQIGTGVTIADDLGGLRLRPVGRADARRRRSRRAGAVATWLSDPYAAPHGGESLAAMLARVGTYVDGADWPDGRSAAVVTPLVARALVVHALARDPRR